jgi:ferritin-like metal-binding protein YciE
VREAFERRLRMMLWVEETLAETVLPDLHDRVRSPELKRALERHLLETEEHVRTLRRHVLHGLDAELELDDDLGCVQAIAEIEHAELAGYEWLVAAAFALGDDATALELRRILEQEQLALEEVNRANVRLLAELELDPR